MKFLNGYRMKMVLVGFMVAIVLVSGNAKAEIIMSEPINVGPVINDATDMQECDFSHDGLELYFSAYDRPGGYGRGDIWVAKRDTLNSPWQEPVNLGPNVNSADSEIEPSISGDGLELYLGSWDDYILRVCKRPSKDAPWSSPAKIGPPVGSLEANRQVRSDDVWASDISADGLSLYFTSTRVGGYGSSDIWVAMRATIDDDWGEPVNLGPNVNTGAADWSPSISTDGLTLVFSRKGSPHYTWATTRKSVEDSWGPAVYLGIEKQGIEDSHGPALSPDGSCLYLEAYYSQWGGYGAGDFWQVEFIPIVDFNGDGIVDSADMCIMVEHWQSDYPLFDIAPPPLGDGVVDVEDLKVLAEHLFEEVEDPTLIAHWPLDETEGMFAADSAGDNDAVVLGGIEWQPDGGQIDGALKLDGVSGYAITGGVRNPVDGPFSIIAWVNGGAPGQVVVSQQNASNWLAIDAEGCLMTELKCTGRSAGPLYSETVVTDGQWHRIGLVWDGSNITLCVDGVVVAEDTRDGLQGSGNGLNIGAGKMTQPGTYFSGLIDDIRIYNRAVNP